MSLAFLYCVEAGFLEAQAVLLSRSIRRWVDPWSECPIHAFAPRAGDPLKDETLRELEGLGVVLHTDELNREHASYPHCNKIYSCTYAETRLEEEFLAFVDTDTVFLNPPEDYDGGELVVQTAFGEQRVKLAAGNAVMYPSGSTHCVAEVTRGERIVAVTWVQSMVRNDDHRRVLFDLDRSIQSLASELHGHDELVRLAGVYHNLLRRWADV